MSALAGYSGTLGDIINNETSYHLSGRARGAICIAGLALAVELLLPRAGAAAAHAPADCGTGVNGCLHNINLIKRSTMGD